MLKADPSVTGTLTGLVVLRPDIAEVLSDYLQSTLQTFLAAQRITQASEIPPERAFHEFDFKSKSQQRIDWFYKAIFHEQIIVSAGRLRHIVRYQWTFDKAQCPIVCEVTQLRYGLLTVGGVPAAFTIFFPMDDLVARARNLLIDRGLDTG